MRVVVDIRNMGPLAFLGGVAVREDELTVLALHCETGEDERGALMMELLTSEELAWLGATG